MTPEEFLKRWKSAVAAHDPDLFEGLIAKDGVISSPAFWAPKGPRSYVMTILRAVSDAFDDFVYDKDWIDGKEIILEFTAQIGDTKMRGIDRITLNDDGHINHIEIMIRPVNALMVMAEQVANYVAKHGDGVTL